MYDSRRLCEDTSSPDTLHGMLLLFLANEGVWGDNVASEKIEYIDEENHRPC